MKRLLLLLLIASKFSYGQTTPSQNFFIITTDGFRWQEVYAGADSAIINNTRYVKDTGLLKELFWSSNLEKRRSLLMPFVWNVLAKKGSLYGNRNFNSEVSVSNPYRFSYAGYNEIFTGFADRSVIANSKKFNHNHTVLDFLNEQPAYKDQVAAFTSWNHFEYIFNKPGSNLYLNSGYQAILHDSLTANELLLNAVQQHSINSEQATRNDMLTFVSAKEYIINRHPKVVYIGFGETDENAHHGYYDEYLQSAHLFDSYLSQLWYLINSDPFYKNNTSIIITTDHGRGKKANTWMRHGMFTSGSSNTWLLTIGPQLPSKGEVKNADEIFNEQFAKTIAAILGFDYNEAVTNHPVSEVVLNIAR